MIPPWIETLPCAVTVCDTEGVVIYQNEKSKETFAASGDFIGKNLRGCHTQDSWTIIQRLLKEGASNSYTIEKRGVKKLIHQTPWYQDGKIAGLVELSIELPAEMSHHVRG